MKFKLVIIIMFFTSIINLFSVETVNNNNDCKDTFNFELINSYELESDLFDEEVELIGIENKIWVRNMFSNFIVILNENGTLDHVFEEKGKGPGEYLAIAGVFLDKSMTNIVISDMPNYRFSFFNKNGEFLTSEKMNTSNWTFKYSFLEDKKLSLMYENNKQDVKIALKLETKNKAKYIYEKNMIPEDYSSQDNILPIYAHDQNNIILSIQDPYIYQFIIYDRLGNIKKTVFKDYSKVLKTVKEISTIKKNIKNWNNDPKLKKTTFKNEYKYYSAIKKIFLINENIWVLTQGKQNKEFFDVYNMEGKLIKQSNLLMSKLNKNIIYHNGNFYEISGNCSTGFKLNSYKVKF